jgi:hypothetical protein
MPTRERLPRTWYVRASTQSRAQPYVRCFLKPSCLFLATVGNRRFRVCIENHVDTYMNAKTRQDKSSVITLIVKSIKESSSPHSGGGFVLKVSSSWLLLMTIVHDTRSIFLTSYFSLGS